MKRKELFKHLKHFIGKELIGVKIQNDFRLFDLQNFFSIDNVTVCTEKFNLSIFATDIPHFWGEGDMDFIISHDETKILTPKSLSFNINEIKVIGYKPKGLNLFPEYNLIQIEFKESYDRVISIGFFDLSTDVPSFISTGEIFLNFGKSINIEGRLKVLTTLH